ncbi:MAG: efflux RND transporter permease subunit [Parvibaculaceae bacterium]|nr:efflux RND transporter permease subunit [Parvibaculaceae bacterium]
MNISAFSVRNWQFTLVVFAGLAFLGYNAIRTIPLAEDPSFPIPFFIVTAVLPGADPQDVERLVSKPIEDAINGIDDLNTLQSTSRDGVSVVTSEFSWDVDPEAKYDEVVREVNAIRPTLPPGLTRLDVQKVRTTKTNIVQFALVSDTATFHEMENLGDNFKDIIDRAPGVWETEVWGAPQSEVQIKVDLGKLARLRLPLDHVLSALQAEGTELPAGVVHVGDRRFNLKGTGSFDTVQQIEDTVVMAQDGRTIRVRDVASVAWDYDEPTHLTWYNGKRAIFVTANMKDGENVFDVRNAIFRIADDYEKNLPADVKLVRTFDQSKNVAHRLTGLGRDFLIALALVVFTLLPLGPRASLVVMISIPLSLAIGVTMLKMMGFTINQLSIAGFVLALGLLVDDSIVVTENIARHLRMGMNRTQAAIAASKQIYIAVLGCTATLMLAFVPLLFLPEGAGKFIRSLPVTVLVTVGASLFVALTIIPFLASRILKETDDPEGNAVLRVLMGGIHRFYRPALHFALERPRLVVMSAGLLFLASLPLFSTLGFSLFPPAEVPQVMIDIDTPEGTAMSGTNKALNFVEKVLAQQKEVDWYLSNLGHGNPQVFYNVRPKENLANTASVFVQLKQWRGEESHRYLDSLRHIFAQYPGAQIIIRVFENGPPIEAPIAVRVLGDDIPTLRELAAQITHTIAQTPGTRDIDNPARLERTDLSLGVQSDKAAALGIPAGAIDRTVHAALQGETVAQFRESDGDEFPVRVRLPMELGLGSGRNDLNQLDHIYVPTEAGAAPLSIVTEPTFRLSPARIDRYQRERSVTVTAYTETGFLTSKVSEDVYQRLQKMKMPPGYTISAGGQAEAQSKSFAGLGSAVIVAIFGIFAVLVLEFRSLRVTAVVAAVIPLGIMGALLALWVTGNSLSFTAVIGLIALIGIEIKNSILLVDFTTQLREQGLSLKEAIEKAGEIRFLPVLLTSATAIGGLMPLALERSGLYSPLALVIIGGLISSTVLSRIVTPAIYLLLAPRETDEKESTGGAVPVLQGH